jgi:Major Facilitator Superfamily
VTQLPFGRLYLLYNNKLVFLAAIIIFEAGSALCGAAPNSIAFIMGRALAGVGSSGVFSGVIVVMIPVTPLEKRPMYQGLLGAIFGVSSVIGPLIGGAFTTSTLTWRWCFYINLPIGAVSMLIVVFFLHLSPPQQAGLDFRQKLIRMDPIGNLLFLPSIICLLLALQWGGTTYAWNNVRIIVLFVLFGVLLICWVITQVRGSENATVPPRIFQQRTIISGFCFSACIGGVMLSMNYYLSIWFQAIDGVDALQSGIRSLPFILALVVSSILAGVFVSKVGYYSPCVIVCSILMSIGTGLLTTLRVHSGSSEWIGYQVIAGLGMGFGMQQSGLAAQVVLRAEDVPISASLMFFSQQLGGSIFVYVAETVFLHQLESNLQKVIPADTTAQLVDIGATELRSVVPPGLLPQVLQAYNESIDRTFYVGMSVACVSIIPALLFEWRSVKGHGESHDNEVENGTKAVLGKDANR